MEISDLVHEISSCFKKMSETERIRNIREFAEESLENLLFVQEYFPELYAEAFSSSQVSA